MSKYKDELTEKAKQAFNDDAFDDERVSYGTGTASGFFYQNGAQTAMTLNSFCMERGKIYGQGEDDVGSFIIEGFYSDLRGGLKFKKQYVTRKWFSYLVKYSLFSWIYPSSI